MRRISKRKVARVIIDIACLVNLGLIEEKDNVFSSKYANDIWQYLSQSFDYSDIGLDEVEFILLAQSSHDEAHRFQKIMDEHNSEFIDYHYLKDEIAGRTSLEYFWIHAERLPLISSDDHTLRELINTAKEAKNSDDVRKSLYAFHAVFDAIYDENKIDLGFHQSLKHWILKIDFGEKISYEELTEYINALSTDPRKTLDLLKICIKKIDQERKIPAFLWETLLQAVSACTRHFSNCLSLNPDDLLFLDKKEKIPTLLLLSPFTKAPNTFGNDYYRISFTRSGEISAPDCDRLDTYLAQHQKMPYEQIFVYLDFDYTVCPNGMLHYTKDPKNTINADLVDVLNTIKSQTGASFRMLTSRYPWHYWLNKIVTCLLDAFSQFEDFDIEYDYGLKEEVQEAMNEIKIIVDKNLPLHDEIQELKVVAKKLEKFRHIQWPFDPETIPEEAQAQADEDLIDLETIPQAHAQLYKDLKYIRDSVQHCIIDNELFCVSNVTAQYKIQHGLEIAIDNRRHLSRSNINKLYKVDHLIEMHGEAAARTLVVLVDDSPEELKAFSEKTTCAYDNTQLKLDGNEKVDAISVRVYHEGKVPKHFYDIVPEFISEAACVKRRWRSQLFKKSGNSWTHSADSRSSSPNYGKHSQ